LVIKISQQRKINPAPGYTCFLQGVIEEKGLKREECAKNKEKGKGGIVRDKVLEYAEKETKEKRRGE
jgi:hypothetical protein